MIGSLRGTVLERQPGATAGELLLEVGGVGYRVAVPTGTLAAAELGGPFFVHVHTHVRDDAIILYGFASRDERARFDALLGVHGVGPALALALLSVHGPAALQRIVITDDADALTLVPGVGKKTAVRLLMELKAKLDLLDLESGLELVGASSAADPRADVRAALAGLGYGADEVREAMRDLPVGESSELLREALRQLAGGAMTAERKELLARDSPLDPVADPVEMAEEVTLRPRRLADFVGQTKMIEHLAIVLEAARRRGEPADHLLFCGPPGLGKTTIAGIVANELGVGFRVTSGPALVRAGDLAAILTDLSEGDVLFIDEIHRLGKAVEEILYPAIEDFQLDVVLGKGPAARSLRLDLPRFTLIGATTRTGLITGPLRDRFGMVERLDYYEPAELEAIIVRSAGILAAALDPDGAQEVARRSRGTPRIANRLLKRVRDFAEVRASGVITLDVAKEGLALFGVDDLGLDKVDRAILNTVCARFAGGPVGLSTLAVSVGEEPETVEDVYEPFLLQQGLLKRTPRGRVATAAAWDHLGLTPPDPRGAASLW